MTAAHVAQAASAHGQIALAGPTPAGPMGARRVDDYEVFPDRDVALLFCRVTVTPLKTWLVSRVQVLTDLSSFGFPHAVTRENATEHFEVVFRAYKGYVIATRGFQLLPGKPAVYEVSCPFPEGMSGGPVLLADRSQLAVAGVVLGVVRYGGVEQNVGIAMIADEIAAISSERLGARSARS